jgi:hypothetical protein
MSKKHAKNVRSATLKENISKIISNVALLTFEGAAFNVTFLALLLI